MLVKSTVGSGRIVSIDATEARAVDGVLLVYTHENAPHLNAPENDFQKGMGVAEKVAPLQSDEIFYAGQYIAMVVAETFEAARDGASRIVAQYDERAPKIDLASELPNAIHFKESFGEELQYERGAFDAAFAAADVTIDETYVTPQENHNPIEPHATLAEWDGDKLTLHDSTQWVIGTRNVVAAMLGIPREDVRVVSPFVGGGFRGARASFGITARSRPQPRAISGAPSNSASTATRCSRASVIARARSNTFGWVRNATARSSRKRTKRRRTRRWSAISSSPRGSQRACSMRPTPRCVFRMRPCGSTSARRIPCARRAKRRVPSAWNPRWTNSRTRSAWTR